MINLQQKLEDLKLPELITLYATVVENPVPGDAVKNPALMIKRIRVKMPGVANVAHVVANGAAAIMQRATMERTKMAKKPVVEAPPAPKRGAKQAPPPPPPVTKRGAKKAPPPPPPVKGKKPAAKKEVAPAGGRPRTGVGATIRQLISDEPDRSNKEIAAEALEAHPESSTNAQCVAWYKNDMRKKGEL